MVREHDCAPPSVPAGLSALVDGYRWARDRVGESGGTVYRLHGKPGAPDAYLKHGRGPVADDITDEMVRLRWLARHVPVPAVLCFLADADEAWLLMTALPGTTAWQMLHDSPATRTATVDALVRFLLRLHTVPAVDCPFTSDHGHRLARAWQRLDAGLVDAEDFDAAREGWTGEQVWDALHRLLPLAGDAVVTHGDFSLDNILIEHGEVTGCIDVGRAGVADRYQDLAILWNSLGEFGSSLQQRLFAQYGLTGVDARRLEFHLMLDELF